MASAMRAARVHLDIATAIWPSWFRAASALRHVLRDGRVGRRVSDRRRACSAQTRRYAIGVRLRDLVAAIPRRGCAKDVVLTRDGAIDAIHDRCKRARSCEETRRSCTCQRL